LPVAQTPVPIITPSPVVSRPFAEISLDWVSGLPITPRNHDSVLQAAMMSNTMIDRFSKWEISIPYDKTMTTQKLIDCLWDKVLS
jgi:hypothetical protein